MKQIISCFICFIVILEYSSCVAGGRIVAHGAAEVVDDVATEADTGGGFPPYNYTGPTDSDDTEHVDFDLDAATTNTTTTTFTTTTTAPVFVETDHTQVENLTETERKEKASLKAKHVSKAKKQGSTSTFRHLKKKINAEMFKMYKYMPLVQSFTWLGGLFAALTLMFKIHEVYLS